MLKLTRKEALTEIQDRLKINLDKMRSIKSLMEGGKSTAIVETAIDLYRHKYIEITDLYAELKTKYDISFDSGDRIQYSKLIELVDHYMGDRLIDQNSVGNNSHVNAWPDWRMYFEDVTRNLILHSIDGYQSDSHDNRLTNAERQDRENKAAGTLYECVRTGIDKIQLIITYINGAWPNP